MSSAAMTIKLNESIHCCKCERFELGYTEMTKEDQCVGCGHSACIECLDYMFMKQWVTEIEDPDEDDMLEVDEDWVEYTK
jgi:hypothetical protein